MSVQLEHRIFNVDEYQRMLEAGILSEDDHVELIDGEIIKMSPIGSRHVACVNRLNATLNRKIGEQVIISIQNPVRLDNYSEPEPDIALLKPREDFYAQSLPTPADVLLIIEVADASVNLDRRVKLPLYARAGIPEVWLVNLPEDRVESHSEPVNGAYQSIRMARRGEAVSSESIRPLILNTDDILG